MLRDLTYRALARGAGTLMPGKPAISIFMFHGLHPDNPGKLVCNSSRSISDFRQAIDALAQHFDIISMDEALTRLASDAPLEKNAVVLTFDDSVRCVMPAAEYLASRGLQGLFYLSTGILDQPACYWWHRLEFAVNNSHVSASITINNRHFPVSRTAQQLQPLKAALKQLTPEETEAKLIEIETALGVALSTPASEYPCAELMTREDVVRLQDLGMTVGSHGVSHANMSVLDDAALEREMVDSREAIETLLNEPCRHFSYPYGLWSSAAAAMAERVGYQSAVTAGTNQRARPGANPWTLDRISLHRAPWKGIYQAGGEDDLLQKIKRKIHLR